MNSVMRDTGLQEDPAVRLGQVNAGAIVQVPPLGKQSLELNGDFGADLVAASADPGTDGDQQVLRPAGKAGLHRLDHPRRNPLDGAAPARVDCRHRFPALVREEQGQAIRGSNRQQTARLPGEQRVAFSDSSLPAVRADADVGVDLAQRHQFRVRPPRRGMACTEAMF